jgi:hypothetical protein
LPRPAQGCRDDDDDDDDDDDYDDGDDDYDASMGVYARKV